MIVAPCRAGVLPPAEGRSLAYSATTPSAVQLSHQVPVRGACGGEVLVALGEFGAEVEDPLLQLADPAGECFDVGGGTEPGGFPDGLSECFGQASFEPGDVCGETAVTGREVRDVGRQRPAADLGPGGRAGPRFGCAGQDGRVQVAVAVNQAAADARTGPRSSVTGPRSPVPSPRSAVLVLLQPDIAVRRPDAGNLTDPGGPAPVGRVGTEPSARETAACLRPSPGGWCATPSPSREIRRAASRAGSGPCRQT